MPSDNLEDSGMSSLYVLSTSESILAALRLKCYDSSGRKFKVTEAVQQIQFIYESVALLNKEKDIHSIRK